MKEKKIIIIIAVQFINLSVEQYNDRKKVFTKPIQTH